MTSSDFDRALAFTLKWEGGLVDDPKDPGGITNFGISLKSYPQLGRMGIRHLTREAAAMIYKRDYWEAIGADQLPWPINCVEFDTAVNCGLGATLRFLMRAKKNKTPIGVANAIIAERLGYYQRLVARRPVMRRFLRGWMNRLTALKLLANNTVASSKTA